MIGGLGAGTGGDFTGLGVGGLGRRQRRLAQRRIRRRPRCGQRTRHHRHRHRRPRRGREPRHEGDRHRRSRRRRERRCDGTARGRPRRRLGRFRARTSSPVGWGSARRRTSPASPSAAWESAQVRIVTGLAIGGIGVGAGGTLHGVGIGGIGVGAQTVRGLALAGFGAGGRDVRGALIAAGWNRLEHGTLRGLTVSSFNQMKGSQHGLAIGIVNYAEELHGVQIGLINIARNNSSGTRVLPIVNVHRGELETVRRFFGSRLSAGLGTLLLPEAAFRIRRRSLRTPSAPHIFPPRHHRTGESTDETTQVRSHRMAGRARSATGCGGWPVGPDRRTRSRSRRCSSRWISAATSSIPRGRMATDTASGCSAD